jgi:HEAT repeat protein
MILPNAFFLIILIAGIICIILIAILIAKPLALLAYLRAVQAAQESYRKLYIPFFVLPEPSQDTHQLLRGAAGAGKTTMLRMYQYAAAAAQNRRAILRGRDKFPVYVPLKHYNLFLKKRQRSSSLHIVTDDAWKEPANPGEVAQNVTLIDFLCESDLPGMRHIRRYLKKLIVQGRIVFLCDGLNEIDHHYLDAVSAELAYLLRWTRNRLVITCRDVDYSTQPSLKRLVNDGQLMCTELQPLQPEQIHECVEHYVSEQGDRWTYTPEQILEVIDRSRLRYHCTNPMMLFTFMEIIDGIGVQRNKQIDTRGQLLREYVSQSIKRERGQARWNGEAPAESAVLAFLGEIACAARWANDRNAIKLPISTAKGKATRAPHSEELARELQAWLDEHPPQGAFATGTEGGTTGTEGGGQGAGESGGQGEDEGGGQGAGKLTPLLTTERRGASLAAPSKLVQFAQSAGLIDIGADGVLSFCHELIAAYLVAAYFSAMDSEQQPALPIREELLADAARWSDVVAIWAGLLDDPMLLAERLAKRCVGHRFIVGHPSYILEALSLSLVCIGVLWTPPQAESQHPIVLPSSIEEVLVEVLQDAEARERLADIFTHCAEEGGQEIYHALVPLLGLEGIDKLLVLLDETILPDMLFSQLAVVVDDAAYEAQVKRLIQVLGRLGSATVERAAEWSQPEPGRSVRLRAAMVNILGGTNQQGAVEPLLARLNDPEPFIRGRAINALIRLGPAHTLPHLIRELEQYIEVHGPRQLIHWAVLMVLERFLDEQDTRRVTPVQRQRILEAIVSVLTSDYAPETQHQAVETLVRQAHVSAKEDTAVIELLVSNLSSENEEIRRSVVQALQMIGAIATPVLLAQLGQESSEMARKHIIEVFEGMPVLDQRALPRLLHLLADPAPVVQKQAASALRTSAPDSIPGLIELVLFDTDEAVATRAAQVLGDIGEAIVVPVMQALPQLVPGRTRLLVQVLEHVHDAQAIPALIALLESPGIESLLAVAIIHALSQYSDARVVPPLLAVLASSTVHVYEEAINVLSFLGKAALPGLIAALDIQQETNTIGEIPVKGGRSEGVGYLSPRQDSRFIAPRGWEEVDTPTITSRVRRALLGMVPFPGEQLIAALAVASEAQAEQIVTVLLAKGNDAAQVLVTHLAHPDDRVQRFVRHTLTRMEGHVVVPALLAVLHHPVLRPAVNELLHMYQEEAIPQLVSLLGDSERGDAAAVILLEIGPTVLPLLVPGLDDADSSAQARAQRIIADLVRQATDILPQVVRLFSLSLPQRAREALLEVLTNELAGVSIPALLEGLENVYLLEGVCEAFVRLVQKHDAPSDSALQSLLDALRMEERQRGAKIVLVNIGAEAVPSLINLIADPDLSLAQVAQEILRDIGVAAFPAIWAASHDVSNRARREAALNTFRSMPTVEIKGGLIGHLLADELADISMALGLLLERIADEATLPRTNQEMIQALLEYLQTQSEERATQRIIALLLLVGGSDVANHIAWGLYHYHNQPGHQEQLTQAFLLLGKEAEEVLLEMLRYRAIPPELLAEVVGVLGMMTPHQDVYEYTKAIGYPGLAMYQTSMTYSERQAVALRALGGLLAGGHLNSSTLQNRQANSLYGSPEHELYSVLLGKPYGPQITKLENDLRTAQYEYEKARRQLAIQLTLMHQEKEELEEEMRRLEVRNQQLEETNQRLQEMLRGLRSSQSS